MAIFAKKMLNGEQPTINGNGWQTRDFTYIADVVQATIEAMNRSDGLYNIGTGEQTAVIDIYEQLAEITGFDQPPAYGAAKKGEVERICLLPSWPMTHTSLEEGLRRTVESLRD